MLIYSMENTRNLMDFRLRELREAARLLALLKTKYDRTLRLGPIVTPEYNPDSGFVFLIDSNFNIAMINGQFLEDWHRCPNCGREGFLDALNRGAVCCKTHISKSVF